MSETDEDIVAEAKKRFARAEEWEASSRNLGRNDVKFGNADSDNGWQWETTLRTTREADDAPCLTINKTRQHCLQIINDARDHEDSVQVRPVGDGATFDAAQVYEGIIRHIEYVSNASQAYDTGTWHQVFAGIGYWRVVTDFLSDDSFDQEIYVRRVPNRESVYLDPNIKEYDGSDAAWGIIFDDVPRAEAEAMGLIEKGENGAPTLGNYTDVWVTKDHVRIAEYFRRSEKSDELIELPPDIADAIGMATVRASQLPKELRDSVPKDARRRKIVTPEIEWFKIVGDKIVDRKPWAGKYIPIVRIIGEETVIDGVLDRKGHVRALKDPQRMYNYNSSAAVQYGALQAVTPWLTAIEAIGPHMEYWGKANISTAAVLPYNHLSEDGQRELPAPTRIAPPMAAPVFIEGMKIAQNEMMLASGQYQAVMGAPSNETSGKAINARQRQGDNATGHYLQHRATAIRFTGKILIDLIPKIYDTARVTQIIARDGTRKSVQIDPNAQDAHQNLTDPTAKDTNDAKIAAIFNPSVGQYDVMSDVGPSYATSRQEAFNAYSQIIAHNPAMTSVAGDLMFKAADFPGADVIAERLRNMVPQQALGGPSQEMQQMQAHVQAAMQAGQSQIEQLHAALKDAQAKLAEKEPSQLDWYKAETDRLKATGSIDPEAMKPVIRALVSDVLGMPVVPVMHAHAMAEQAMQPQMPPEGQMQGQPA